MVMPITVVKASVKTDATGARAQVPVIVTPAGVLEPLLDYFLAHVHDRSLAWMAKVAKAARLFLEYLSTNPRERDNYRLFLNFAQRLYTGTFDPSTGHDSSGLGWRPIRARDARQVVTSLNDFFDHLSDTRPAAALFNPRYAGSSYDRMLDEAAFQYRRDRAFLGHTWATSLEASGEPTGRRVRAVRNVSTMSREPPAFPEEHFRKLLAEGFKVGERYDWRGILITLLLHGAGYRPSEVFHLYVVDVVRDPKNAGSALVLVHHPSEGDAPADWRDARGNHKKGNRAAYLRERWGLTPRNEMWGYKGAGWKGGIHEQEFDSLYFQAYWFQPEYGELFLAVWYRYLQEIAALERPHPYAFVNTAREPLGAAYSLKQYNKAHRAAVRRIGLTVSKAAGTTPHGHRHAYGRRLQNAGVSKELIRRFMHHSSLSSQEVYTQPTQAEALAALRTASKRLEDRPDVLSLHKLLSV